MKVLSAELKKTFNRYGFNLLGIKKWKNFKLDHKTKSDNQLKIISKHIKEKTDTSVNNKVKGIYIYFNDIGKCLYVGKSKDIASRMYQHYKESQNKSGHPDWRIFFGKHKTTLNIYFKEVDLPDQNQGESLRIIIERHLISSLSPEFEKTHPTKK